MVPGLPHHGSQHANGRRPFPDDDDYALDRDLLAEQCRAADFEIWTLRLMPNHEHLLLVPADADRLRRALAVTCRRYVGAGAAAVRVVPGVLDKPTLRGAVARLRAAESIGQPLGCETFIVRLERF